MNREISVRSYCPDDLHYVKKILSDYPSPTGRVWTKDAVSEMLSDALKEQPDGVFVAELGKKVVGLAIVMHKEWFNIAYLDYIQVKREWIGKGLGHKLMQKCIRWAKERGARILYTETAKTNAEAIGFYQRHGFKITGRIPEYYKKGLDAVILARRMG